MEKNYVYGFKAFNKVVVDETTNKFLLKCRDYTYFPGEIHKENCIPECCHAGFHFCENIDSILRFYDLSNDNVVVYPVIALGNIDRSYDKLCTNVLYVCENPIPNDYKKSRAAFNAGGDILTFPGFNYKINGCYYNYSVHFPIDNKSDLELFDSYNDTDIFKFNNNPVKKKDVETFRRYLKDIKGTSVEKLINIYTEITGKQKTLQTVIDVIENNAIINKSKKDVIKGLRSETTGLGYTALYSGIYGYYGYYKVYGNWYYVPELNTAGRKNER